MIDEIASGINEKRKGIHKLIKMCFDGKIWRLHGYQGKVLFELMEAENVK